MPDKRPALAPDASRPRQGRRITFYLPGMFLLDKQVGRYPAVSVTGGECAFGCDHCNREILRTMLPATSPETLVARAQALKARGMHGLLVSGGCDAGGRLPWREFAPAIKRIKEETGLLVSAHAGFPDAAQAELLRCSGVDQVLVDVIGDDDTLGRVYHAPFGVARVREGLRALQAAGLSVVPHIVCGLHYGQMLGEMRALELVAAIDPALLVVVSLMPLPGTPMRTVVPPSGEDVVAIIREARRLMPRVACSLGCARQRGARRLERLVLREGVERMALPSAEAVAYAGELGYEVRFQQTCCSVHQDLSAASWAELETRTHAAREKCNG